MNDAVDLEVPNDVANHRWMCGHNSILGREIVFFCQLAAVFIVIITCVINLSLHSEPHDLWVALLSSSLGIILPAPTLALSET